MLANSFCGESYSANANPKCIFGAFAPCIPTNMLRKGARPECRKCRRSRTGRKNRGEHEGRGKSAPSKSFARGCQSLSERGQLTQGGSQCDGMDMQVCWRVEFFQDWRVGSWQGRQHRIPRRHPTLVAS